MEIVKKDKKAAIIIIAIIIMAIVAFLAFSKEDVKRVQQHQATTAVVFEVTGMSEGACVAIQGPETYEAAQGATIIAAVNKNVHVGDYVTRNGVIVDRYGNPL